MGIFDGSGSFGLGLGGFDVSDFLGTTGTGGFGSMNFDANVGDTTKLNRDFGSTELPSFSTSLSTNNLGNITPNTSNGITNSGLGGLNGFGTDTGNKTVSWMDGLLGDNGSALDTGLKAWGIYEAKKQQDKDNAYRDDAFNANIKTANDKISRDKAIQNQLTGGRRPNTTEYYEER